MLRVLFLLVIAAGSLALTSGEVKAQEVIECDWCSYEYPSHGGDWYDCGDEIDEELCPRDGGGGFWGCEECSGEGGMK